MWESEPLTMLWKTYDLTIAVDRIHAILSSSSDDIDQAAVSGLLSHRGTGGQK
jgi:hypothetical protein